MALENRVLASGIEVGILEARDVGAASEVALRVLRDHVPAVDRCAQVRTAGIGDAENGRAGAGAGAGADIGDAADVQHLTQATMAVKAIPPVREIDYEDGGE